MFQLTTARFVIEGLTRVMHIAKILRDRMTRAELGDNVRNCHPDGAIATEGSYAQRQTVQMSYLINQVSLVARGFIHEKR